MIRTLAALVAILALTAVAETSLAQSLSLPVLEDAVGSGLQGSTARARLSDSQHGGVFVTIAVDDSLLGLVAPDASTPGTSSVDVFVANGSTDAIFVVQGLESATGTLQITASAPGFVPGSDTVEIIAPVFDISGLFTTTDVPDPESGFRVRVGIPFSTTLTTRSLRVGGPGVIATVTVDDPAVAELITTPTIGGAVTVAIAPGSSQSASNVASGGVAFNGLMAGVATVTASIPGFTALPNAIRSVTVTAASITLEDLPLDVGSGLESQQMQARLNGSDHGGVTVRIESDEPTKLLVSPDSSTEGQAFVDVFVADGQTAANYYLHGLEGQTGIVSVTASAAGFGVDFGAATIITPSFRISGLAASLDTLDPDDPFTVDVGLANAGGTGLQPQLALRPGGPGATVTVTSIEPTVGLLTTSGGAAATREVFIAANESRTPSSVANGGVAFDGISTGSTTVVASIPGFTTTTSGFVEVEVSAPGMSISTDAKVGSGLSSNLARVFLDATGHGGVTLNIAVDDSTLGLVSPSTGVAGTSAIDVFVADGSGSGNFFVHGLENQTGTLHLTVTATGFTAESDSLEIVGAVSRVFGLNPNQETFDTRDDFQIQVGVIPGSSAFSVRTIRPGAPDVDFTVSVDNLSVGQLVTLAGNGNGLTVTIPAGSSASPNNVSSGGIALDGLTPGVVSVSFAAPGFTPQLGPTVVTVSETGIQFSPVQTVGAGLRSSVRSLSLGGPDHPGVTVRVESLDPALARVSSSTGTPGTAFFETFVPTGSTSVSYVVEGLDGQLGTATLEVSAPGFTTTSADVDIAQPGVQMVFLNPNLDVSDADDSFNIRVGLPNASNSSIGSFQSRRAGAPPLVATVTSATPTVVELVTLASVGGTVTTQISPGGFSSPGTIATGGVAARAVGSGTSLVSVAIPGFLTVGNGSVLVNVTNTGIAMPGVPAAIGAGLQVGPLTAALSDAFHGGVTLTLSSQDDTKLLVTASPNLVGSASESFVLANGQDTVTYYLQAPEGVAGTVAIDAIASGFTNGGTSVDVQTAAIQIAQLATTLDVNAPNDLFTIQIGVAEQDGSALAQLQTVRPGGTPPALTVSVDDSTRALLETGTGAAGSVNLTIAPGQSESGTTFGNGAVALDPALPGSIVVSATGIGLASTEAAAQAVILTGTPTAAPRPRTLRLAQNQPNPFNPATTIAFDLPRASEVSLRIYDAAGRAVRTLVRETMPAGEYRASWKGRDERGEQVASGTYYYMLEVDGRNLTRKMTLLK